MVISPSHVHYDKTFAKELARLDEDVKKRNQQNQHPDDLSKQPLNMQRMTFSQRAYAQHLTFPKETTLIAGDFLIYKFYEKFPNLLILTKDTSSSGTPGDLRRLSEKEHIQYVLNFPSLYFYKQYGMAFAKLGVQLFDDSTGRLLIDTTYVGNWFNPGFEFSCPDSSLNCTINNALAPALDNVVSTVAAHSPTIIRERKLWADRLKVLRTEYYGKPVDSSFVSAAVPPSDSTIVMADLYQVLISDDSTKFVGFFLRKGGPQGLKQLSENQQDKNVQILTSKTIQDTDYLTALPQTYAYLVKAVKYQGKWYYEKSNVTMFDPQDHEMGRLEYFNTLQQLGFFKENSTAVDPDFWETNTNFWPGTKSEPE